jgi:hypothetical protein
VNNEKSSHQMNKTITNRIKLSLPTGLNIPALALETPMNHVLALFKQPDYFDRAKVMRARS